MSEAPATSTVLTPGPAAAGTRAASDSAASERARSERIVALSVAALGVVFGDIGTSPLYALRECFKPEYGLAPTPVNVLGVLSLIVWSLLLVVSLKYVVLVLRADDRGEGGILALLSLVVRGRPAHGSRRRVVLVVLGLLGAALLYGDGVITPAISVLSAVEGVTVTAPRLTPIIVPATLTILLLLFLVQHRGTAAVGRAFGPIMFVWFVTIGLLGAIGISRNPAVLAALAPAEALHFLVLHRTTAWLVLGAVVLTVTGTEALYADIGHFGTRPIRLTWFALVLPALLLNYFGQGALVLRSSVTVTHPFFHLAPVVMRFPLIGLATIATVIASQALISGVFSLTRQAIQLGFCPRLTIRYTSEEQSGQIYLPAVNSALMLGCLLIVLAFRSSSALGAAYGIAVTGTMAVTTILFCVVAYRLWHWPALAVAVMAAGFLTIDLAFFTSNLTKVVSGGWIPLAIAAALYVVATTWRRGHVAQLEAHNEHSMPLEEFIERVRARHPFRSTGTGVFLTAQPERAPSELIAHFRTTQSLPEQVVLMVVLLVDVPHVTAKERVEVTPLPEGFFVVVARYGFMQTPSIRAVMARCVEGGIVFHPETTTYYIHRDTILSRGPARLARWRKRLFIFMERNAPTPAQYFRLPPEHVVELGGQLRL